MISNAFVIGHPIAHSRSPLIHNFWLRTHGCSGTYKKIDVPPDDLKTFVATIRSGQFVGGNVTIPHKQAITMLCDELEPAAIKIGAVNTIFKHNDRLIGTNTDALGFLGNLDQSAAGWDQQLDHVVVLGAGGAARAILLGLLQRGAKNITLLNRTRANAEQLAAFFGLRVQVGEFAHPNRFLPSADLLVNTSAVGLNGTSFKGLDLTLCPKHTLVTDIVYTPLLTPLLLEARACNLKIVDGLGMLLHQAVPGFAHWFGVRPTVDQELRALIEADLEG